ncbi:FHA domain-containing protein [Methylomonas sp. LL1]|uniref:FHA domain-containing protein n=1 Tax=Methylomonas sp. LL1 TaxID=2785785 RepID=UPI0018C373B0|nr:FHA domain-containing protein [Methylomonas sp. LL1]QPK64567.1 FHA domain-containing protein [Methylomonas sp. LL1]
MAKFTIYFKDKPIHSGIYDAGVVHIGRDDSNELVVDSLAVAPAHAVAVIKDGSCVIKQLNEKFPLLVNNHPSREWNLQNNDVINIGKHYIVYNTTESVADFAQYTSMASAGDVDQHELSQKLEEGGKLQEANLQVMDGPHIGRILPLKKAMTRLGRSGGGVAVISRRKDGYYMSALQGHEGLMVNKQPLGENTVQLHNNDIIEVDKTPMMFFLE